MRCQRVQLNTLQSPDKRTLGWCIVTCVPMSINDYKNVRKVEPMFQFIVSCDHRSSCVFMCLLRSGKATSLNSTVHGGVDLVVALIDPQTQRSPNLSSALVPLPPKVESSIRIIFEDLLLKTVFDF